jgi:hypothetical protein
MLELDALPRDATVGMAGRDGSFTLRGQAHVVDRIADNPAACLEELIGLSLTKRALADIDRNA